MAEVNAKDLTTKTAPASTDSMLLFGTTTNEGAKITVDNLANNILERIATKTFPNQVGGSSAATILAQLATLNSNLTSAPFVRTAYNDANEVLNGVGYVGSAGTNCPEGLGYTMILAMRNYNDVVQIALSYRSPNHLYFRSSNNGTWSKWYSFTGTLTNS